jgi:hypothetical protein
MFVGNVSYNIAAFRAEKHKSLGVAIYSTLDGGTILVEASS